MLYLKSSYSGDEDQFECYRALGQHIGEKACEELSMAYSPDLSSFEKFAENMKVRAMVTAVSAKALLYKEKKELKWAEEVVTRSSV